MTMPIITMRILRERFDGSGIIAVPTPIAIEITTALLIVPSPGFCRRGIQQSTAKMLKRKVVKAIEIPVT